MSALGKVSRDYLCTPLPQSPLESPRHVGAGCGDCPLETIGRANGEVGDSQDFTVRLKLTKLAGEAMTVRGQVALTHPHVAICAAAVTATEIINNEFGKTKVYPVHIGPHGGLTTPTTVPNGQKAYLGVFVYGRTVTPAHHHIGTGTKCEGKFKHNKRKAKTCVKKAVNHNNRERARREETRVSEHPGTNGYLFAHEPPPPGNPDPKCRLRTRGGPFEVGSEGDPQYFTVQPKVLKYVQSNDLRGATVAIDVAVANPHVVICYALVEVITPTGKDERHFLKIKPNGGLSSAITLPEAMMISYYSAYGRMK